MAGFFFVVGFVGMVDTVDAATGAINDYKKSAEANFTTTIVPDKPREPINIPPMQGGWICPEPSRYRVIY